MSDIWSPLDKGGLSLGIPKGDAFIAKRRKNAGAACIFPVVSKKTYRVGTYL